MFTYIFQIQNISVKETKKCTLVNWCTYIGDINMRIDDLNNTTYVQRIVSMQSLLRLFTHIAYFKDVFHLI